MPDNQEKVIFTPKVEEEGRIDELPVSPEEIKLPTTNKELSTEELQDVKADLQEKLDELEAQDLDKKNYYKVSPTLYIKSVESENDEELFKVLNPEIQEVETRELSDDEKKEVFVKQLKESRVNFRSVNHDGNVTANKYDAKYKQKRKRRNKATKASRKKNRK